MYIHGQNRCIGCMQPLDTDGGCSFCGLKQEEYHAIPRCLQPGMELASRYVIGKVLGEGSFGITYAGWDKQMNIRVAIKEYFPSDMVSRDVICGLDHSVYLYESEKKQDYDVYLKKIWEEAKCLSRFNKVDGIVSVRDFFYENNTAYLVMHHIDGISVKEYVSRHGKIPADQVLKTVEPIILALEQVHGTGIIHRDISPDNVMIRKDGSLVLIDFGAARMRNIDNTKTMTVMFKRGFSPEEQYRCRGKWGAYTDVYSLCATMYFMMTGTAPVDSVIRALGDDLLSLESMKGLEISAEQSRAVMKGMEVSAKDRWQSMRDLYDALYREEIKTDRNKNRKWYKKISIGSVVIVLAAGTLYFENFFPDSWQNLPSDRNPVIVSGSAGSVKTEKIITENEKENDTALERSVSAGKKAAAEKKTGSAINRKRKKKASKSKVKTTKKPKTAKTVKPTPTVKPTAKPTPTPKSSGGKSKKGKKQDGGFAGVIR